MRRVRIGAAAAVLLVATAALAGCSSTATATKQIVGVAMPTTTSARWVNDGKNVAAQLRDLGRTVDLKYAEDDVPTQVAQIQAMIDEGAGALIVGAIDGTALKGVLANAAAKKIPVISYDRLIRDTSDIAYYATFDNALVGAQQADSLLEGLGVLDAKGADTHVTGPFSIELIAGSPDDNNATVFFQGAMKVLKPYLDSGVLVVGSGQTDFATIATPKWAGETAAKRIGPILDSVYATKRVDAVLAPADIISVPVLEVLRSHGYGTADKPWPVVTGQDADIPAVKAVIAGEQHSTIYKDTRQLAEVAVSMVDALLKGEEPETNDITSYDNGVKVVPSYLLKPQVVTKANYSDVLVGSGYYTQQELG